MPRLRIDPVLKHIATKYQTKVQKTVRETTKARINRDTLGLITNINDDMRDRIVEVLREGEDQGRSVAATASKLLKTGLDKGIFKSARRRAYLIARTELHRARQRAAVDLYEAADIRTVKWVGIGDDRICVHCKALDGRNFNLEEIIDRLPPLHPRCRCRLLPSNFQLRIEPKRRKGMRTLTITPTPDDYKYVIKVGKLRKSLEKADYSSVLAELDSYTSGLVKELAELMIDPADIHKKNEENDEPHITVRYGLHTEIPADAREAIGKLELPIKAAIVGVEVFKPEGKDYDVLVLGVNSPAIEELNDQLGKLPNTETYPFFHPHITVVYLKRGTGDKYKELTTGLEGRALEINEIDFSDKKQKKTELKKADTEVKTHTMKTKHGITMRQRHHRKGYVSAYVHPGGAMDQLAKIMARKALEENLDKNNPEVKLAFDVADVVKKAGGKALFVGGAVRDAILGRKPKDMDVEVYGVNKEDLQGILQGLGSVDAVGKSFGVFKLSTSDVIGMDVSTPRRESKSGVGHKGFIVESDPTLEIKEAARRRDLTVNSMAYDPIKNELIDEHGGLKDLNEKRLRATSKETFSDDSLRVLRVMRFAGQLEMQPDEELIKLCKRIDLSDLPKDRLMGELSGLLLKAKKPSIGLRLIPKLGIDKILPELTELQGVLQEPCLINPRAPIFSEDGWKPIGKIKEGDEVLTHKGRFRKVKRIFKTPGNFPKIITIQARANRSKFKLALTDEHPVLTSEGNWVFAKNLKIGQKIKILGHLCDCGECIPYTQENCVCCRQKKNANEGWKSLSHKEIISKATQKQSKEQFLKGVHPFQNPNNIYKIAKGLSKSSKGSYLEKILGEKMRSSGITFEKQYVVSSERRTKPTQFNPKGIPIRYILDFAIPNLQLAIECDGERFHKDLEYEEKRQQELETAGWTVLHFKGSEVLGDLDACVAKIQRVISNHKGEYRLIDAVVMSLNNWSSHKIGRRKNQLKPFTLYNLEVEEDESYIAIGFVVHNCWHPEGDAWEHTMQVMDAAAELREQIPDEKDKLIFMLAALFHDIGKPPTTLMRDGILTTWDHDEVGADMVDKVLGRFTNEPKIIEGVENLVRHHMKPTFYHHGKINDSGIRRLAKKVDIPTVVKISLADKMGRGERKVDLTSEKWLLNRYYELGLEKPKALDPVVLGRHLIPLGIEPSRKMGEILNKIYEAQLDGKFLTVEEGLDYAVRSGLVQKITKADIIQKSFNSIRKSTPKFVVDRVKMHHFLTKLRKAKTKTIPVRVDGEIQWGKRVDKGYVLKNVKLSKGDEILLKSGDIANVTALGKDGLTARDGKGNKHQVFYKEAKKFVRRRDGK